MTPKRVTEKKYLRRNIDKILRLRQYDESWEGTGRISRMWVSSRDKPPYRPYIIMFASGAEKGILRTTITESSPTPERIFEEVLHAMRRPMLGSGAARRPTVVYLDNTEHVEALTPWMAELNVRCEFRRSLPALENALAEVYKAMYEREPFPAC